MGFKIHRRGTPIDNNFIMPDGRKLFKWRDDIKRLGEIEDKLRFGTPVCIFCAMPIIGLEGACGSCANKALIDLANSYQIQNNWLPTSENINHLPEPVRKYIHDLETNVDPAGLVQENACLKENIRALQTRLGGKNKRFN
jgi:hypothetical protein